MVNDEVGGNVICRPEKSSRFVSDYPMTSDLSFGCDLLTGKSDHLISWSPAPFLDYRFRT